MSESVAVAVNDAVLPSLTEIGVVIAASTGAVLVSITDSVKVLLADRLGAPLSVTVTVMLEEAPPSLSPGVPVMTPVDVLIEAHAGSPVALKVSV